MRYAIVLPGSVGRWALALAWWLALSWPLRRSLRSALGGAAPAAGPAPPTRPRRPKPDRPQRGRAPFSYPSAA